NEVRIRQFVSLVFLYKRGLYYGHGLDGQSEQFRGRVVFFKDELTSGNASIKIQNTRLEDNGTYTCVLFKPKTNEVEKEITIRLNVVWVSCVLELR
uniref:Immunoglobulin V-set domain-containing protein n=1 Tax=Periophthalmus magnuspinnatus TaxID=409849 RepID=A0A3B3ZTJ5_9GOBI